MKRKFEDETPDIVEKELGIIGYEEKQNLLKKEGIEVDYSKNVDRVDEFSGMIKDDKKIEKIEKKENTDTFVKTKMSQKENQEIKRNGSNRDYVLDYDYVK